MPAVPSSPQRFFHLFINTASSLVLSVETVYPKTLSALNLGQRIRYFCAVLSSSCSYYLFIYLVIEFPSACLSNAFIVAHNRTYSHLCLTLTSNFLPFIISHPSVSIWITIHLCGCPGAVSHLNSTPCAKSATCLSWSPLCTVLSRFLFCGSY